MTTEVTRKQAILLSVLCAILVIILFWQFLISPQIKSASKAKEDLETLNQQYSDLLVQSESYDQNMAALDGWNEKNSEETKKLFPLSDAERIDRFLSGEDTGLSRSALQALVADGHVLCNGKLVAKSLKLKAGDTIVLEIPDAKPIEAVPQDIPLEIVYEDEHLLVVNKPKGMVVHPAPGNPDGTLVNALLWHCKGSLSGIGGEIRPGIVHRIDKDTSGLLVVAKDDATHIGLSQQMAVHSVERAYRTIVYGGFAQDEGFVESNLGRSKTDRKKMAVYPASEPHTKYAYTGYQVLERLNNFTMLECRLKTGRTHQIRVHMASIQHPVAGDPVYGPHNCITSLHGQCLHAKTLGFVHPITGEHLRFDSELPEYFTHFLATLRRGTV